MHVYSKSTFMWKMLLNLLQLSPYTYPVKIGVIAIFAYFDIFSYLSGLQVPYSTCRLILFVHLLIMYNIIHWI
jgi:hypothetical protein